MKERINVLVSSSVQVRTLNRQFREKNSATDVLSFPAPQTPDNHSKSMLAGEIAISADIAMYNATKFGHSAAEEVKILALHGILHLAGYDHERDNGEMERKEMKLRRELRLPDGLIERAKHAGTASPRAAKARSRGAA